MRFSSLVVIGLFALSVHTIACSSSSSGGGAGGAAGGSPVIPPGATCTTPPDACAIVMTGDFATLSLGAGKPAGYGPGDPSIQSPSHGTCSLASSSDGGADGGAVVTFNCGLSAQAAEAFVTTYRAYVAQGIAKEVDGVGDYAVWMNGTLTVVVANAMLQIAVHVSSMDDAHVEAIAASAAAPILKRLFP